MTEDAEEQWLQDRLSEAPPFTPEQIEKLRRLLAVPKDARKPAESGEGQGASEAAG